MFNRICSSLAMVLLLSQVVNAATTWTQVSFDQKGNTQFEVQDDSIKKANALEGTVNAAIRIKRLDEYNERFGVYEHSDVANIMTVYEFDCIGPRAKLKYEKIQYRSGQRDFRNGNVQNPVFSDINKGSALEYARGYVCKKENPWQLPPPPEPPGAKSPIHDKTSCIAYSETLGSVVGASWAAYCQGATSSEIRKVVEAAHNKATTKLTPEDFKNAHDPPSQELCSSIKDIVNMFGLKGAAASAQINKSMSTTVENGFKEEYCKNY